jgi:hypothetical protein
MSLALILAQDHLTWKHANTTLSGQNDLSISGWLNWRMLRTDIAVNNLPPLTSPLRPQDCCCAGGLHFLSRQSRGSS